MADLRKEAKKARKQLESLDIDLASIRDRLPKDVDAIKHRLPKDFDIHDLRLAQKREDEAANRGFMGGFLLGALVGVILALIFAPKKGEETREIVAHAATDLKNKAADVLPVSKESPADKVADAKDNLGEAADDLGADAKATAEEVKEKADDATS
jgi:gas vesicle protein